MTRFVRPHIARMAGYVPGEQPQGGGFIKLNTNENPVPAVARGSRRRSRRRSMIGSGSIPTRWRPSSCSAAAALHGVEPDMVLAGNGSDDLLDDHHPGLRGAGRPGRLSHRRATCSIRPWSRFRTGGRWSCRTRRDWTLETGDLAVAGIEALLPGQSRQSLGNGPDARADRRVWPGRSTVRWSSTRLTPISPTRATMPCR